MQMDKGLDTGDMILTARCTITEQDTSASVYDKLAQLGPIALLDTIDLMVQGNYPRKPQMPDLATYAHKLDKNEAELDWQLSASVLHRKIRAYIPWPVSQFTFTEINANSGKSKEHRIRVLQASVINESSNHLVGSIVRVDKNAIVIATKSELLALEILQLPGKKALPVSDILNSRADWFKVGACINGAINNLKENNDS
jgi:methionyl-tRNA formyltransferase